jgi:nucleotide-binding universal stress UspA family protein
VRNGERATRAGELEVQMITSAPLSQQPQREHTEQPGAGPSLPAISRIAVPLDGSQLAERVLAVAAALARAFRAELLLVRAYGPPRGFPLGSSDRIGAHAPRTASMTVASLHLARIAIELRNCGVRVATRLLPLHADEAILEVAANAPADLILLAVEPHVRWGRASSLGRVADRVVRQSDVPVLLTASLKGAQVPCAERVRAQVLVRLEPAIAGERALPYARAFAEAFHGHVTLIGRSMAPVASVAGGSESSAHEHDVVPAGPWETETLLLIAETSEEFVAGISGIAGDLIVWGRPEAAVHADDARWIHSAATLLYVGHRPVLIVP